MKITDWENSVSKKYTISNLNNIDELYRLLDLNTNNFFEEFYAAYILNTKEDIIIFAFSTDGKNFTSLSHYKQGDGLLEKTNGEKVSIIDAGLDFVKFAKNKSVSDIKTWENFYLKNFISKKLNLNEICPEIVNDYINVFIKPNIETITEGYINSDMFNSFYTISENDKCPQVLVIISSTDGKNISNYFSIKVDENLSIKKYIKILNNLNLPKLCERL